MTCPQKTRIAIGIFAITIFTTCLSVRSHAADEKASDLPLNRVVLFSSGVGFYEHNGQIEGNGHVDLKFNVDDVNDLLKSMVLQDLGGGRISTVNYESKDPITKTLKTFAIDLTANPTLADLLKQVRGEKVQVEAPTPIVGTIVGVETRKVKVNKDEAIEQDFLNLLTEEGLRSINLEAVSRIKLLDADLNSELTQALQILATAHDTDKKTVTLNFLGQGKRDVRVGYIQESPIWKTSYRLVLKDDEKPFLQGWAIVENTTEQDWNDVNLTLISGRPISFVMDLYQPLYVHRPEVKPELYASLRPQTYGQDLAAKEAEFAEARDQRVLSEKLAAEPARADRARMARAPAAFGRGGGIGGAGAAPGLAGDFAAERPPMDLQQGVESLAQAGDVGELFQYVIATPVKLPRQQSAMLPIVNESVDGTKVSIYNQSVQAKHPLNGLRLKNTTKLNLMQGPVTVFDDGAYAGDARIEDLQPGTERLVSYALDLETEVAPESKGHPEQLVSVKIAKGTLHAQRKYMREQKYTVKNSGDHAKTVLVEYPFDANWKLVTPKDPAEKTRDLYRFKVEAKPGEPATLNVEEERVVHQQFAITNLDDNTILYYVNAKVVNDEAKNALREVIKRKTAIQQTVQQRTTLEQQIQAIEQQQNRIRQNMERLDRTSDLYNRYVKMFGEQEDQFGKLRDEIEQLKKQEQKQRQDLDKYLLSLEIA
ncbi:MAG: hypothetical protein WD894_15265 [Pirellulales bacterium]